MPVFPGSSIKVVLVTASAAPYNHASAVAELLPDYPNDISQWKHQGDNAYVSTSILVM